MPRKRSRTTILRAEQVEAISGALEETFGETLGELAARHGLVIDDVVRFMPLATKCREAREAHGLSIKDLAEALRLPQRAIRDIESSAVKSIDDLTLRRVVERLGISAYFRRWRRAKAAIGTTRARARGPAR